MNYQYVIDWVDDRISKSPGKVILAFLLVTAVFTAGLSSVETESGQEQFIEDLPSFEALEDIQRDFGDSFSESSSSTTLLLDSSNAVSKQGVLRLLHAQEALEDHNPLSVSETNSPAEEVARQLDPEATTLFGMTRAVESSTPEEVAEAVRSAAGAPGSGLGRGLSEDFNLDSASASAAEISVTHTTADPPENRDERVRRVLSTVDGNFRVIGDQPETNIDSLLLVLPAALVLIVVFLIVAYRDLIDLALGLVAIAMTLIWTFGFLGLAGIPFTVLIVAVPPLLIAVGIDFGIHSVNRYREERVRGKSIIESMRITTDQLLVAFFIVTGTSVVGFLSNLVSAFPPVRDFGLATAFGIIFTFLIFGVFLPAGKVYLDRLREGTRIPNMGSTPLGSEESAVGKTLSAGVTVAEKAPIVFVLLVVVSTVAVGAYASDVGTGFEPDDFLPPEETPEYLQLAPEPLRPPAEYPYVKNDNFRDRKFEQTDQILMYVEGPMQRGGALKQLRRAGKDTPPSFESENRHAESDSIVTLISSVAEENEEFARLVRRNDADGDGVPDSNLDTVYDSLLATSAGENVDDFLSESRTSTRVVYEVDGDASDSVVTEDAYEVSERYRYEASPTGFAVIFKEASNFILETVVQTLIITLVGASIFLVLAYWVLEGRASLGVVNVIPIATTVVLVVATMRLVGIKFNAINGTILAITIGLGIDYSVHVVHRFSDEYEKRDVSPALRRTVVGTGGALTGSMLTTVFGVGVIGLALNPALAVFGILTAASVFYAYLTSIFVLPSFLMLWDKVLRRTGYE